MDIIENPAVIWMICGIVGILLELAIPGLIIVFFGIGALTSAFTLLAIEDISLSTQLAIFFATSAISLALFRNSLKRKFFSKNKSVGDELNEDFIGKKAVAINDFIQKQGRIEFNGSQWKANSEYDIKKDQLVEIIEKESITLTVKPI